MENEQIIKLTTDPVVEPTQEKKPEPCAFCLKVRSVLANGLGMLRI
jgi:hypothetical protein